MVEPACESDARDFSPGVVGSSEAHFPVHTLHHSLDERRTTMVRALTTMLAALSSTSQRINCFVCFSLLLLATATQAIKFDLEASSSPHIKCIWNYALSDSLVIITINTAIPNASSSKDENDQRVDVEIVDGSKHNNIYLSKKNIRKETRMAINTHSHADLGVCVKNSLKKGACGTGSADSRFSPAS